MLRPLVLDLLDILAPLAAATAAFFGGRFLDRLPLIWFRVVISLAVAVVFLLGLSYFTPLHGTVCDVLWHVGGVTTIACIGAMLLLGVVMSSSGRSTSTGFLRAVVGLVALILVLNSGGRLWWRFVSETAWDNAPDANGSVRQTSGWTCSPATAAMLLHQYGIKTTEGEMAYLANTNFLGTDAPSIAQALSTKGRPHQLVAHVMNADYDACVQQTGPFLACIKLPQLGGHAVLVLGATAESMDMIDPRFGHRQKIARAQIEPQWEGKIVYLQFVK